VSAETRAYTIELPTPIADFLEAEAKTRGLTPEEWFVQKVYAAGSSHTVSGDIVPAPQPEPPKAA
jgi:hypothetical protein